MGLIRIYGYEFLAACHYTGKFDNHKHCKCGDIFNLFGGLMLPRVNIWMEASHGTPPPSNVVGHWSCAIGDVKYLIYHVTSPN